MADVVSQSGVLGSAHLYNEPDLSPTEFMLAVMRDEHLPLAIRLDAAHKVAPFTERARGSMNSIPPRCTIVIGGLGPCDNGAGTKDPAEDNGISQSFPRSAEFSPQPPSESQGPLETENPSLPLKPKPFLSTPGISYLEKKFPPPAKELCDHEVHIEVHDLPDPNYSRPPTADEIREIKAAINKLRPDLAHLPVPEPHLCACGHWMFGPCPLGERCRDGSLRDPSKLN